MKVLIVGGGGREHALAWKVAQSNKVENIYVAPGNAGTATEPKTSNIQISAEDISSLKAFALSESIDLTIVGPENPLVAGIVDDFTLAGLRCFGPTKSAAILEGSKSFTKDFLKRHNIPTAAYEVFTNAKPAVEYVKGNKMPVVIKADGLAAGKGVIVVETEVEAITTINNILDENKFGEAGHRIVIEEFLQGEEASFIVMVDGQHILPLASSQDHKARDDGDKGPNTGGMGAYSPAPVITGDMHEKIINLVIEPTVRGMAQEQRTFTGFLYAGLMIAADGTPNVLEFNCRFGDPETQPILMRLKSDLVNLCNLSLDGKLDTAIVEWDERVALGVVLACQGYPASARKGDIINGLGSELGENIKVFHAGTSLNDGDIVTSGGRVLCVTALADNILSAKNNAYDAIKKINWDGMFYRNDIGYRAIDRN